MAARWQLPTLSIRATVLAAIVAGVVLPATVVVWADAHFARAAQAPLVERNRAAVQVLAAALLSEPAWTLSRRGIDAAVERILQEPSVCEVRVLDLQPAGAAPLEVGARKCSPATAVQVREAPVLHEGLVIGRMRLSFDDEEVDRLLAQRHNLMLWLVPAQVVVGVVVLLGVLSLRLLRPIDRLKASASAIASRSPAPPGDWRRRDELGQLGQHLNEVRSRIDTLIEALERKNAQLRKMAMHDHLTGLPNRALFRELFNHEAAAARRAGQRMALLFIDLDRFKNVNDTLGHAAGDAMLLGTSQRLLQALRQSDLVCRMSGDEFIVLLRHADNRDIAAAAADRLLRAIEAPLPLGQGREAQVSASIGVALFAQDGEDFDTLVRHADLAMYEAKQAGRGCVGFYHAELDARLVGHVELERELAHAIAHDELVLHYQPIVDAITERVLGCEALVRWQHPGRGLLMPASFIALAEDSGLIRELGEWTIDAACAQLRAWHAAGVRPGRMAVNVSALQFRDHRLVETFQRAFDRHGVKPGEIEVELTESTLMADTEASQHTVARLRDLGVALVVDDFGTGYSSLGYLKRLRPDKLKIDRAFVRDLPDDADDRSLTQAILALAQTLHIGVVAEGVETVEQRHFLREAGCQMLQGYLTGRPAPAGEIESRLRAQGEAAPAASTAPQG